MKRRIKGGAETINGVTNLDGPMSGGMLRRVQLPKWGVPV